MRRSGEPTISQAGHTLGVLPAGDDRRLRVAAVDPWRDGRWDRFVSAQGSIFHHSAWLACLEAEYARDAHYLVVEDEMGEVEGVLPLVHTKGVPLLGRSGRSSSGHVVGARLSSLPRTPAAGPCATSAAAARKLVDAAIGTATARRVRLELKTDHEMAFAGDGLTEIPWRVTHRRHFTVGGELRFGNARNHGRLRWAVNKGERRNVKIRPADSEADLRRWYTLYLEAMRWNAVPARPYRFFRALVDRLGSRELMTLVLAEQTTARGTRILAGSMFFELRGQMFYAFNGRRTDALSERPNDLILWHVMHDAYARGFSCIDLGETGADNASLADFKRKWGTVETRLYRSYFPAVAAAGSSEATDTKPRRLHGLWRRVPLRATAIAGDMTYRWM